jgi:copper(I)-binding protein
MKKLAATLLVCATSFVVPVAARAPQSKVTAIDAWVRQPATVAATAAYVVVVNDGDTAIEVVSASSPSVKTIELHTMSMENGMMRMKKVPSFKAAARSRLELRPGGNHLMLFDLAAPLAPGAHVAITLTLADGTTVPVDAVVRAADRQ